MITALVLATLLAQASPAKGGSPSPAKAPASTSVNPGGGQVAAAAAQIHQYSGVSISPAGDRVASVDQAGEGRGVLVIRSATNGEVLQRIDPCLACGYGPASWSPSGGAIAFVASGGKEGGAQLMVAEFAGRGAPRTRTVASLKGLMASPHWSADGKTLAVLATAGARKQTGATQAGAARVGEIGAVTDEQRIATAPAAGGALSFVSPADTFVYEYDWTPDGRGFVGTAAKGDGDNNWWIAKLEAFGLDGSERVIAAPKVQMNFPRVSADGKSVAYIGGLMSDFGAIGGDVWIAPFAGGPPHNLTEGYKASFTSIVWRAGEIRATGLMGANATISRIDAASGKVSVIAQAPFTQNAANGRVSWSADGQVAAATVQDFEHAPAIGVHPMKGAPRAITHDNDDAPAHTRAQSVTWTHDGFTAQGWLLAPMAVEPGRKYPMLVQVHGGPSSAATPSYVSRGLTRDLLDHGYYIFLPNPRGSYGQGEAFTAANKRDFGGGDLKDILAGVDAAEKVAPIDDARLGVYGFSYGGFMTMWAVGHTDRFKAAVSGAGLSNWSSYYGENGIDQWMIPFFGKSYYEDPAIYDKLSPIRYVKDVKTPTFIYVGERDIECPPGQSIEFWHGLKAYDVPTSLVIYEGQGHGIRDLKMAKDSTTRTIAWFDKYLGAPAPAAK